MRTWSSGACVSDATIGEQWIKVDLRVPTLVEGQSTNNTNSTGAISLSKIAQLDSRSRLIGRADCRTTTILSGDGCWAVANRCGISQSDLEKYNRAKLCTTLVKDEKICCTSGTLPSTLPTGNPDGTCKTRAVVGGDICGTLASKCGISLADFMKANTQANCNDLMEGQPVCCTSGKFPDIKPKPDGMGNCAVYTTKKDDGCGKIAAARGITIANLENWNKNTWGWTGCDPLWTDFRMCVSSGNPPMPASVPVSHMCSRWRKSVFLGYD